DHARELLYSRTDGIVPQAPRGEPRGDGGAGPAGAGRLGGAARAVQGRDGEGHRPGRPSVAGAGEAPAGPGERLQRWRRGDRAEPQTTLDGAGRQALRHVRHRPEGDGVPRQGGRRARDQAPGAVTYRLAQALSIAWATRFAERVAASMPQFMLSALLPTK